MKIGNVRGASAKYWSKNHHIQHNTNTPTALQKLHVCPLGMCVVVVPNIGLNTNIFNTTHIRPQHFRNFMLFYWECTWCQCQIFVVAPAYPTLHKCAHRTSETSCVSTDNMRGASAQYLILEPPYQTLHKYDHSTSETSYVSTGNVRGASAKYWSKHQRIKHYTNTPTTLQKLHVCPLGMCVVLVKNICISTSISNTTQIRQQHLSNLSAVGVTGCICVVLDMLVLIKKFGTSTTHIPSGHT